MEWMVLQREMLIIDDIIASIDLIQFFTVG